jgi:GNAT superfamily N-acetyltransferase
MRFATTSLSSAHDRGRFRCGNPDLDDYFIRRAGQDARRGIAQLFVMEGDSPAEVRAYYSLSMTGIEPQSIPDDLRNKLPRYDTFPGALIGRFAVALPEQGKGIGRLLLLDALHRVVAASAQVAAYAAVVDAIDESAADFYRRHGFLPDPRNSRRLFMPVATARRLVFTP